MVGAATGAVLEAAREARIAALSDEPIKAGSVAQHALTGALSGAVTAAAPSLAEAVGVSDAPALLSESAGDSNDKKKKKKDKASTKKKKDKSAEKKSKKSKKKKSKKSKKSSK